VTVNCYQILSTSGLCVQWLAKGAQHFEITGNSCSSIFRRTRGRLLYFVLDGSNICLQSFTQIDLHFKDNNICIIANKKNRMKKLHYVSCYDFDQTMLKAQSDSLITPFWFCRNLKIILHIYFIVILWENSQIWEDKNETEY